MKLTKRVDLPLLEQELATAEVAVNGLGTSGRLEDDDYDLYTFDQAGAIIDVPPEAGPVVDAHVAPPLVTEFTGIREVSAIVRTTDAAAHEVFRFPCELRHLYHATLTISGIDAGNFAAKIMEGRFVWKRISASPIISGLTVVSDIHDAAAASWAPNYAASGTDVIFTVAGAAGRTIDWLLQGSIDAFAPEGLA